MDTENTSPKSDLTAKLSMLLSGSLMGTVGLYVTALASPFWVASCARGLFGALFIFIFFAIRKKLHIFKQLRFTLKFQILQGLTTALTVFCYFGAILAAGYAVAAFLLYTGGAFALIFFRFILKEHVTRLKWLAFAIAVSGVAVMMELWRNWTEKIGLGFLFGLLAGAFYGCSILLKKVIFRKMDKIDMTYRQTPDFYIAMTMFPLGSLTILFIPFSFISFTTFTINKWLIAIGLGLLPTSIAFSLYNMGLKKDDRGNILILSYAEPIMASILNVINLGMLPGNVIAGGILIITANILILLQDRKRKLNEIKKKPSIYRKS